MLADCKDSLSQIRSYLRDEFSFSDDEAFEMIDAYLRDLEKQLFKAKFFLECGDTDSLRRTGHAIKGLASNIGSSRVSGFGKLIEDGSGSSLDAICSISSQVESLKAERNEAR